MNVIQNLRNEKKIEHIVHLSRKLAHYFSSQSQPTLPHTLDQMIWKPLFLKRFFEFIFN